MRDARAWKIPAMQAGDTVAVIGLGPDRIDVRPPGQIHGAHVIAIGRRREQLDHTLSLGADA